MALDNPRRTWTAGSVLLTLVVFIALGVALIGLPLWLEILAVIAIVVMVGVASTMLRRRG